VQRERLVLVNVRFFTGTVVQFCPAFTANLTCPVTDLPLNSPEVALPVMVATVAFAPVPVFQHEVERRDLVVLPRRLRRSLERLPALEELLAGCRGRRDGREDCARPASCLGRRAADAVPLLLMVWFLGVVVIPGVNVAVPFSVLQLFAVAAPAGDADTTDIAPTASATAHATRINFTCRFIFPVPSPATARKPRFSDGYPSSLRATQHRAIQHGAGVVYARLGEVSERGNDPTTAGRLARRERAPTTLFGPGRR